MKKSEHLPIRTCVGCGTKKSKRELLRIVRNPDGTFSIDKSGKLPGRGAYLCQNQACAQLAKKKHQLDRSFCQSIPLAFYDELADVFDENK